MKNKAFSKHNLAFSIISVVLVLILVFSIVVSLIGFDTFTSNMNMIYHDKANDVAYEAITKVTANHIEQYLKNGEGDAEWQESNMQLQTLCNNMDVDMIYVISVDTADYNSYTTVFHVVQEDSDKYSPVALGQKDKITNDSFKKDYKLLYTDDNIGSTTLLGAADVITAIHPLKDDSGKITALLCVQVPMTNMGYRIDFLKRVAIFAVILVALAIIIFSRYIRKKVVNPIRTVSDEALRFSKENKKGEALGEISKINEISSLSHSIDEMEDEMLEYIDNLTAATAEKERIGAELSIAAKIQMNAVPNTFPAFPDRTDFDIYASMTPAKEVGGDFYNYFLIDDDHLALVIADVSGKGIPAALFMMVTNNLITETTHKGGTPADILKYVNESVCAKNEASMFVTVWLGILELSTGKITACNAGHDFPALCRKDGSFELVKAPHDIAVGAMEGLPFDNYEIQMNKGDKLFLYTDGLPEAANESDEMLTLDGMLDVINRYKNETPKDILLGINNSVNDFVGGAPQFDDLTMLCIELKGTDTEG